MSEEKKLSNVAAIKTFFEKDKHGVKVEMKELKELSREDREELGNMCREALD